MFAAVAAAASTAEWYAHGGLVVMVEGGEKTSWAEGLGREVFGSECNPKTGVQTLRF